MSYDEDLTDDTAVLEGTEEQQRFYKSSEILKCLTQ